MAYDPTNSSLSSRFLVCRSNAIGAPSIQTERFPQDRGIGKRHFHEGGEEDFWLFVCLRARNGFMQSHPNSLTSSIPLAVRLGFAGSRYLIDTSQSPEVPVTRILVAVQDWLKARVERLGEELGLSQSHFLCGVSCLAAGADTVFTKVCQDLQIPQMLFLPQTLTEFLLATDSEMNPDFSDAARDTVEGLIASSHIISVQVASDAPQRGLRFEDVNLAIVNESDVIICLVRAGAGGRTGGTIGLMDLARSQKKRVLEIQVSCEFGKPVCREFWHYNDKPILLSPGELSDTTGFAEKLTAGHREIDRFMANNLSPKLKDALASFRCGNATLESAREDLEADVNRLIQSPDLFDEQRFSGIVLRPTTRELVSRVGHGSDVQRVNRLLLEDAYSNEITRNEGFKPPEFPNFLQDTGWSPGKWDDSTAHSFLINLKSIASERAKCRSRVFKWAAGIIISTHVMATVLAVVAANIQGNHVVLGWVLAGELMLLLMGFACHEYTHHSATVRAWSWWRLVAEICRSSLAFGNIHIRLEHLFHLPLPEVLKPLVHTINVLHLKESRPNSGRVKAPSAGGGLVNLDEFQNEYLRNRLEHQICFFRTEARKAGRILTLTRYSFLSFSSLAVAATTLEVFGHLGSSHPSAHPDSAVIGSLAIVLPVLAVAVLSLAAALDFEARKNTFAEMLAFLMRQRSAIMATNSERQLGRVILETESRLLGEIVNWFSRRSFTGVA